MTNLAISFPPVLILNVERFVFEDALGLFMFVESMFVLGQEVPQLLLMFATGDCSLMTGLSEGISQKSMLCSHIAMSYQW